VFKQRKEELTCNVATMSKYVGV